MGRIGVVSGHIALLATVSPSKSKTSTHFFAPSLSLERSDLAEAQSLGWKSVELLTLCGRRLMDLKESDERDAWLNKAS